MGKASLYYSITMRRLYVSGSGHSIFVKAVSGGRAGSKEKGAVDEHTANNPFRIGQKTDHEKGVHGGPLPIGRYVVEKPQHHSHLGLAARLNMQGGSFPLGTFGRDGFFIHNRGPHGSDGCIVPSNPAEFYQLMEYLKKSGGGELIVLP